jgi:hypothetical protein
MWDLWRTKGGQVSFPCFPLSELFHQCSIPVLNFKVPLTWSTSRRSLANFRQSNALSEIKEYHKRRMLSLIFMPVMGYCYWKLLFFLCVTKLSRWNLDCEKLHESSVILFNVCSISLSDGAQSFSRHVAKTLPAWSAWTYRRWVAHVLLPHRGYYAICGVTSVQCSF